jgi:hypothetical protein
MNTAETWKSLILILEHEPCDIIYLFIILVLVMYLADFMTSKFSDEHSWRIEILALKGVYFKKLKHPKI